MRFGLFFLAEYLSVFAVSCLATALFLGGGTPIPFVSFPAGIISEDSTISYVFADLILVAVFMGKVLFFIFLMFWVRATLPRMRVDRLMNFAWKFMLPMAFVCILAAAAWHYGSGGIAGWFWSAAVIVLFYSVLSRLLQTGKRFAPRTYRFAE